MPNSLPVAVVLIISLLPPVLAADYDRCLSEIHNGTWGQLGGTDNHGNPVNILNATGITYDLCQRACGSGPAAFQWPQFSEQFTSWLLPWLALLSQLPYGANDKPANLTAVLLTVGSPVLAGYSLALTVLNGRWIKKSLSECSYPNVEFAARILNNLQQAPSLISFNDELLASLIVLPENDSWWTEVYQALGFTRTWSMATITSIIWVVVAYVFTVADTFKYVGSGQGSLPAPGVRGQSIGPLWLWLLPLVLAWNKLSLECDAERLRDVMRRAIRNAHVATVTPGRGISPNLRHIQNDWFLQRHSGIHGSDQQSTPPVYNYSRLYEWTRTSQRIISFFRQASINAGYERTVNGGDWVLGDRTTPVSPENRKGTLEEVVEYCTDTSDNHSLYSSGIFSRMVIASLAALMLQWGTTGAAIIIVYFTPTVGLGCSSASYLLYGIISTVIWLLMVLSTALTYHSSSHSFDPLPHAVNGGYNAAVAAPLRSNPTNTIRSVAAYTRRIAKALAFINATWIVFVSFAEISSFFSRCWCNSCVLSLGSKAYNVLVLLPSDLMSFQNFWIAGLLLSGWSALTFVGFIYLYV